MGNKPILGLLSVLILAPLACTLLSCGQNQTPANEEAQAAMAAATEPAGPPTLDEISNATIHGIYDEPVQLHDGKYEGEPFEPQGASFPRVGLIEGFLLTSDMDGDGVEEAVVMLWESSGGSGTYSYLAALDREGSEVVNIATAEIGDRAQLRDSRVSGNRVELDVLRAGPQDAGCCPGEMATLAWELEGNSLNPVESGVEPERLSIATFAGPEWVLRKFDRDQPAPGGLEITLLFEEDRIAGKSGCNQYMGKVTEGDMPGDLTVGLLAGTMMACPPEIMELEDRYRQQLEKVFKIGFLNGQLALTFKKDDGNVGLLLLAPRQPGE
jgi:heat shock protein HslJ